jgi:hypothetical protein
LRRAGGFGSSDLLPLFQNDFHSRFGLFAGILVTFGITSLHIGYLTASTRFCRPLLRATASTANLFFSALHGGAAGRTAR